MGYVRGTDIATRWALMLAEQGETITLRRAGQADLTVKAWRSTSTPIELSDTMQDDRLTILMSNAEIAASAAPAQAPRRGDTIGGFVIEGCDTQRVGDTVVLHRLLVSGTG